MSESDSEFFFEEGCFIREISNSPEDPALSIAQARVEVGVTTAWHWLEEIEERYLILSGTGFAEVGNETGRHVGPGEVVRIPAGMRQRIRNTGEEDLIFLALCTPRFVRSAYHAV